MTIGSGDVMTRGLLTVHHNIISAHHVYMITIPHSVTTHPRNVLQYVVRL